MQLIGPRTICPCLGDTSQTHALTSQSLTPSDPSALISFSCSEHMLAYRRWPIFSPSLSLLRRVWHLYAPPPFVQRIYNDLPKVYGERKVSATATCQIKLFAAIGLPRAFMQMVPSPC